ncbi:MAG: glutamine amidotransferase [Deferribacteres bacterium]|nr:glutamine amidotransferase [Deferribacteres bacterium]
MKNQKNILIVQCGKTYSELYDHHGDFDDWLIAGMGVDPLSCTSIRVYEGEKLPDHHTIAGAILSGSHAMVTERADWIEYVADWVRAAVSAKIPLLGVCFGHQLLASALGGRVGYNPNGLEFGTVAIERKNFEEKDALFDELPSTFEAHVSHAQSVLELPPRAICLASSALDSHQAFRFGEITWGVQFHPEYTSIVTREYIRQSEKHLRKQGEDVELMLQQVRETPDSVKILHNFFAIVQGASS